ncbi:MAG: hypothetical protein ACI865_001677 [Flavobacteriaceae bacterium]|jgi:hypothetical protein
MKILIVLLVILTGTPLLGQTIDELTLKGSIHHLRERTWDVIVTDGNPVKLTRSLTASRIFDKEYFMDVEGKLIKTNYYNELENVIRSDHYAYVNNLLIVQDEQYISHKYTYDEQGRMLIDYTKANFFGAGGDTAHIIAHFSYDSNNLISEVIEKSDDDVTVSEKTYRYVDGKLAVIESADFGELSFIENSYNSNGLLIEEIIRTESDTSQVLTYVYKDSILSAQIRTWMYQGEIDQKWIRRYNDQGDLTGIFEYSLDTGEMELIETHFYEYDSTENWIKRLTTLEDHSTYLTERIIKYN